MRQSAQEILEKRRQHPLHPGTGWQGDRLRHDLNVVDDKTGLKKKKKNTKKNGWEGRGEGGRDGPTKRRVT